MTGARVVEAVDFTPGGYRYLPGVFQYSAGVAAQPGYAIERASFVSAKPLQEGFDAIEAILRARERPLAAFCACELRSPAPFSEQGFTDFNRHYVRTLERWGLYRAGVNPVARTNVCPRLDPPSVPSLLAFSYTVPVDAAAAGTFVIAGSGEARDGGASYRESIVRLGDVSTEGLREKVRYVVDEMERRLAALGVTWQDAVATQAYTVHDIGPLVRDELFARGAARHGLHWHYARPPIVDIEFEMDVRRPLVDRVVSP
jgi:hypothetical protein